MTTQATELAQQISPIARRSAADIVSELDLEAPKFSGLVLAVCFVERAKLISAADTHRQVKLDAAMTGGGEAIGMIGYTFEKRRVRFYSRLLEEYATETWAADLLDSLMMKFMNSVSDSLGSNNPEGGVGWLN